MPGLFGVWMKRNSAGGEPRTLGRRMADVLRTRPWLRVDLWADERFCGGRVHLGRLHPGPQPGLLQDGSRVWLDGDAYPDATGAGHELEPLGPAEVGGRLDLPGTELARLDGSFHAARYDPSAHELRLAVDRLGFRPLCWAETPDWFAYSPEPKALLAILKEAPPPDEVALRQFFGFDYLLGERTLWEGIRLLPPASVWAVRPDGIARHEYWDLDRILMDPRPEEEALRELGRLWERAVARRRRPGTTPLLLSGGLDSRLVLAELHQQGASVVTVTFGAAGSADMRTAARCASLAGVPHRPVPMDGSSWCHGREEAIWQTDGMVNGLHLHVSVALPEMRVGNLCTLKHTTANPLFGGSCLREKGDIQGWPAGLEANLRRRYHDNPFFDFEEVREESLADAELATRGRSAVSLPLTQGQRRWILGGPQAMAAHCEVANPGVDLEIMELLLGGVPADRLRSAAFYRRFLVDRYPGYFADLPWQSTGRGLDESLPVRAFRSARDRVWRRLGRQTTPAPFFDYERVVRESPLIAALRSEPLMLDDWLDGAASRFLRGTLPSPAARPVLGVLTLETYLRQVEGLAPVGSKGPARRPAPATTLSEESS